MRNTKPNKKGKRREKVPYFMCVDVVRTVATTEVEEAAISFS